MFARIKYIFKKNLFKISILISLILHALFLLTYKSMGRIQIFPTDDPLTETLEDQRRPLEFQLIETPDEAQSDTPPEQADLVSDKNAIAGDPYQDSDMPEGDPYSEGDYVFKDYPSPPNQNNQQNNAEANFNATGQDHNAEYEPASEGFNYQKFSRKKLLETPESDQNAHSQQEHQQRPQYENRKFSAKDLGGFAFNTYNWDFAPYMLAMKKKVERNIFPPPAFTRMGLISGEYLIRFKVMPNGKVSDLQVLDYKGHESLKETSVQAIFNSSPFKPLPADFPEDYLEVTAAFSYYVKR